MTTGDVKEDPDRQERDDEARAPVGDEGKRDSGQGSEPEHRGEVDRGLTRDERGDARRQPFPKGIPASEGEPKPGVGECAVGQHDERDADQAELLADDGEDHVGVRLGQIAVLENSVAEPPPEDPARA
jgi:hypothetical protein